MFVTAFYMLIFFSNIIFTNLIIDVLILTYSFFLLLVRFRIKKSKVFTYMKKIIWKKQERRH